MSKERISIFNKLYLQISVVFLIVLVVFASIALYISVNSARHYSVEVNQRLNRNLAKSTVEVIHPFFENGQINQEGLADIMHSMMVINPTVEVYLLDTQGNILSYVAPEKVVKMDRVSLEPIEEFLNDRDHSIVYGDDPRNPGESKIFSAAPVYEEDELTGYVYIVLASQEYISTSDAILGSYILGMSIRSIILILVVSALVGLLGIWFITKKLNLVIKSIYRFRDGDLKARVPVTRKDDINKIGNVFNEMADTIEENIEELKGLDKLRKELFSNISHDLRTPISSIQGYAETLLLKKDTISSEDREKYLGIIYNSCERLKKQVSELFELSKLETKNVKLAPEAFSISELINDVASKYRIISQKKNISINTIIKGNIPLVMADLSLIDRVLQNILDNAIRFCSEGDTINIEIGAESREKVSISISDTGAGIEKDKLPHIFELYYKGEKDSNEGTGLGLAIVKRIIDLHQSTIEVLSKPGYGTTFTFTLPVVA